MLKASLKNIVRVILAIVIVTGISYFSLPYLRELPIALAVESVSALALVLILLFGEGFLPRFFFDRDSS